MTAAPAKRQAALLLAPEDNVMVALADLLAGERLSDGAREINLLEPVPLGHKIARVSLAPGSKIIKYGANIGAATRHIAPGEWVHLHNLASEYLATPNAERPE